MVVDIINGMTSFYGSTFVYSRFPTKFLYWFLSSVAPWISTMVDTEEKTFEIYACRSAKNALFLVFSWIFKVSWEVLKKIWLERYIQLSVMRVCKYLNQRVRRIGCFKNKKKKKKAYEEIEFHNAIQDWAFTTIYLLKKSAWKMSACLRWGCREGQAFIQSPFSTDVFPQRFSFLLN